MLTWILLRLKEANTYAGIAAFLASAGVLIRPDLWESLVALGVAAAGAGLAVTKQGDGK